MQQSILASIAEQRTLAGRQIWECAQKCLHIVMDILDPRYYYWTNEFKRLILNIENTEGKLNLKACM